MTAPLRSFTVRRVRSGAVERMNDTVAAEEPLDIRIGYRFKHASVTQSLAVTMRTPGHDRELAAGLLLSEGVIRTQDDLLAIRELGVPGSNEIFVELAPHVDVEQWHLRRNTILTSSCGLCGKISREGIVDVPPTVYGDFNTTEDFLYSLPALLETHQSGFLQTGGLHAAALVTTNGVLEALFEDIGRHNALDKLLGSCLLRNGLPIKDRVVFLTSRASFELVQKTAMSGGCFLATVGGPSSLAIETARKLGMTLVCFLRNDRYNVYSGEWRIHSK